MATKPKPSRKTSQSCKQKTEVDKTSDKGQHIVTTGKHAVAAEEEQCEDCGELVTDGDEALTCDICQKWYHIKECCQNVPKDVYKYFEDNTTPQIHWYCKHCNQGAVSLMQMINKSSLELDKKIDLVNKRVDKAEGEINTKASLKSHTELEEKVEKTNEEHTKKINELERKLGELEINPHIQAEGEAGKVQEETLEKLVRELKDGESRKNNIMIYHVDESEEEDKKTQYEYDAAFVKELFINQMEVAGIGDENIDKVMRIGRRTTEDGKPRNRPMLVKFDSVSTKTSILKATGKLREVAEPYNKVVLDCDYTPTQKKQRKLLVEEAKERESREQSGNFIFRVRGPPDQMQIRKLVKKT